MCLYLKFSDQLPETHIFFIWPCYILGAGYHSPSKEAEYRSVCSEACKQVNTDWLISDKAK